MRNSHIIAVVLFFTISYISAQNLTSTDFNLSGAGQPLKFNNFKRQTAILSGSFSSSNAPVVSTDGSVYLFDSWNNKSIIKVNKKKYSFTNFNYNISKEAFMSQIEGDSIYIFDFKSIDEVIVNGKEFKSFFSPSERKEKIYEVIHKNTDFTILKKYDLKIIESSPDPMLNRSKNKIIKIETYFMMRGTTFTPFKLKKKFITKLVEKNITISALDEYVKSNNISYKSENDLKKILDYSFKTK